MSQLLSWASRLNTLPIMSKLSPSASRHYTEDEKIGFRASQRLAQACALEVSRMLQTGWTEEYTARLMETWLRDHGVKVFFHKPFVWWGDRTRFTYVKDYWGYLPSKRCLRENEVFILDVAPILNGYVSDIGYTGCFGHHAGYVEAQTFLQSLKRDLPEMTTNAVNGKSLWQDVDSRITNAGFDNIHATYPFGVLAHRLHRNARTTEATFINFGWQSYWDFLSRGLFGQLLNRDFAGELTGLWAIEPHIGGRDFGAKFEEILVVEENQVYWLDDAKNESTAPCPH